MCPLGGCVISIVAIDALVLMRQDIIILSVDSLFIAIDHFHTIDTNVSSKPHGELTLQFKPMADCDARKHQ